MLRALVGLLDAARAAAVGASTRGIERHRRSARPAEPDALDHAEAIRSRGASSDGDDAAQAARALVSTMAATTAALALRSDGTGSPIELIIEPIRAADAAVSDVGAGLSACRPVAHCARAGSRLLRAARPRAGSARTTRGVAACCSRRLMVAEPRAPRGAAYLGLPAAAGLARLEPQQAARSQYHRPASCRAALSSTCSLVRCCRADR